MRRMLKNLYRLNWLPVVLVGVSVCLLLPGSAAAQPDDFANAQVLFGSWGSLTNDNSSATGQAGEPPHAGNPASHSLWYQWTAPADGEVSVDTMGSLDRTGVELDTVLAVYTGANLSSLAQVAANDDIYPFQQFNISGRRAVIQPFNGGPSGLRFNAKAGLTYYFAVDTKFGVTGATAINWAYKSSGVFRFASEDFLGFKGATPVFPVYQVSETESLATGDDSTFQTYYTFDVPGALVTITRVGGSSGRVLVDYSTANPPLVFGDDMAAAAGDDYFPVQGTLAFDDFETSKRMVIPIRAFGQNGLFTPASNRVFTVVLSNPRPDPNESPEVSQPRIDPNYGTAMVRILDTDIDPFIPANLDTNGVMVGPTNSVFNFEKAHYVTPEDVNDYWLSSGVWVFRSGTNNESVTLNWRVNNYLGDDLDVDEEDNNLFPLQPGSDYATPDPPATPFIRGTNTDFTVYTTFPGSPVGTGGGTITFGQDDFLSKRITFTVTNDTLVEFNEDFHIFLYRIVNNVVRLVGTVNEVGVTILFDDRDAPAGSVDEFHNADYGVNMKPPVNTVPPRSPHPGTDGIIYSLLTQPDGRTILGGNFRSYNTSARNRIARANLDGTLDTTFNPGSGANNFVSSLGLTTAGQVMVGGGFSSFNGIQRNGIARLNGNGGLDFGFNPGAGANAPVWAMLLQPDDKVIIAGEFTTFNNQPRMHIARLNTDGSLDTTFDPGANGPDGTIWAMALQPDGRVLIAGEFISIGGQSRSAIARLNTDGSLDATFNPGAGSDGIIYALALRVDGRIWAGGEFGAYNLTPVRRFARLNANGSLDTSFDPGASADDTVFSVAIQPDGSVYVGGQFSSFNGTHRLGFTRLYPDGTVDTTFLDTAYNQFAGLHRRRISDPPGFVLTSSVQPDRKVMIGGSFSQVGGGQADINIRADINDPQNYTNNVWTEPKSRDGVRNRSNFARLIGGSTPGPGNIGLTYDSYSANQSQGSYSVTLTRTNGTLGYAAANFSVQPGLAQNGIDYVYSGVPPLYYSSWRLTFPPSAPNSWTRMHSDGLFGTNTVPTDIFGDFWYDYTPGQVILSIINSGLEGNRGTTFQLANPSQGDLFYLGGENIPLALALGRSQAPFTVIDDHHNAGVIGFESPVFRTNENAVTATITIVRTNGSYGSVSVAYATYVTTTNGPAATPGSDYVAKTGNLTFGDGQTNKTFTITIINDSIAEPDEAVGLRLFNVGGGATLGLSTAVLIIIDDDSPNGLLNFASATFSTNENAGAAIITVNRSGGSQGLLSVHYATANGSAQAGVDYTGVTNVLTWNPGDTTSKTFVVPLADNLIVDGNRTVNLRLFSPAVNGVTNSTTLGSVSNAVLTIVDNDAFGKVAFSQQLYYVNENGGPGLITVNRSGGIAQSVSVNFTTAGGTAVANADYVPTNGVLTFAPGEVSKTFGVVIKTNLSVDPPRTIGLTLSNASPTASLGFPSTALLTIVDQQSVNEPAGSPDTSFSASAGFNGDVFALALQPDGGILAGGDFTVANNVFRNRIARLNGDGTLDTLFLPGGGANAPVRSIVYQSDGRVLLGGFFTRLNNVNSSRLGRLNSDGSFDTSFNPGSGADNTVFTLAETFVLGQRKLLVGGAFLGINGTPRNSIARLNQDGTMDNSFNPGLGADGTVYAVLPYPTNSVRSGQVLIAGDFNSVNGITRKGVARLNADGSLDLSFNAGSGPDNSVRALALQADERILVGGLFTNFTGTASSHIARLNSNGSLDTVFAVGLGANDLVSAIALQADNRILLAGEFTTFGGVTRHRITRLNVDGTIDPTINFGLGADSFIAAVVVQPDDKIVVGGGFTHFDGSEHSRIARLYGRSINGGGTIEFDSATYGIDENATNALVTVRRRGGTSGSATLSFTTSNGTAVAGINYFPVSTNLVFPIGEVVQTVSISVTQDFAITPDLTVNLALSNPQGPFGPVLGGQSVSVLIITNDDSGVVFSAPNYFRNENANDGVATISILRNGSSQGFASVDFFTTTNGTALAFTNYIPVSNTVTFVPGQTSNFVQVPVLHDFRSQGDTTVVMQLSNTVNTLLFTPSTATLTILDVEHFPGQLLFAQTNYVVTEGDGFLPVTVIRTNGRSGVVTVNFSTVPGTALPGTKYITTNGILTFADGETNKTFTVRIVDNSTPDGNQVFSLQLSNPTGGAGIAGLATVPATIIDNDSGVGFAAPTFVGSESSGVVSLSVIRPSGTNISTTVHYATTNITLVTTNNGVITTNRSAVAGVNYVPVTDGILTFTNGEIIKSFTIQTLHDPRVTGDLVVGVNLFNPSPPSQLLPPSTAVVLIQDAETGFFFTNSNFGVIKSPTNVLITVARSNVLTGDAFVNFGTSDGTARAGIDYITTGGVLTFSNGIAFQTFSVPIINNRLVQGDTTFFVYLTNATPTNVAQLLEPFVASVTITDTISGFSFSSSLYTINENGGAASITVLRTGFTNQVASVDFATTSGSALPGVNYLPASGTLTFTNGEVSKTILIPVIDNGVSDGDKTVLIGLSSPVGNAVLVNPSAATLTIVDIDGSRIIPAGSALISESGPVNGLIDTNETVTLLLALRNASGTNTVNLMATFLATNGVTNPSGPQNYGALVVHGPSVYRPFTFKANGTNGQLISAVLQLADGSTVLSNAVFSFTLGNVANSFTNSAAIVINDFTNATPYPSVINVSGFTGVITKATVTLTNLNHTWPSDINMLLVSPAGQKSFLMAKAGGGNSVSRVTLTFDDAAPTSLTTGQIVSGTNKPTSLSVASPPFPVPAPPPPYSTNLSVFNGGNPNGDWSLYVYDDSHLNSGIISNGWILRLNTANPQSADMEVAMTASAASVVATSNLTYTITIRNYGPSPATGITVTDVLPEGAVFVSSSTSRGTVSTNGNGLLTWSLNSLAVNDFATTTLVIRPMTPGQAVNVATVSTASSDGNPDNNSASTAVTVSSPTADLVLIMSGSPNPVLVGNLVTFSINISNAGPATAVSVGLTNILPPNVSLVSASPPGYSVAGNVVRFSNLGDLVAGGQTSATIVIRPLVGGTITNTANTSSSIVDSAKANNTASVKVVVEQMIVSRSGNNIVISWPDNVGSYVLESTTSLAPPVIWAAVSTPPQNSGGQNTVTLPIGSGDRFFRLRAVGP